MKNTRLSLLCRLPITSGLMSPSINPGRNDEKIRQIGGFFVLENKRLTTILTHVTLRVTRLDVLYWYGN